MAHQKKVVEANQVLAVSSLGAVEEVRSAEAYGYAEAGTDRVGKDQVGNQDQKVVEDHSGIGKACFEIVVVHSETEEGRSGIEVDRFEIEGDRFEIEGDRPGMVGVRFETGQVHSDTEVRSPARQADLDTAEATQMTEHACRVAQSQTVAERIAIVEVEQRVMAVADMEVLVGHMIAGMRNKSNCWEVLQIAIGSVGILESRPERKKVSIASTMKSMKNPQMGQDSDLHLDFGYHAHQVASHLHC